MAERQTESRTAIIATRGIVSLLKGLENAPLLFGSDPDVGVGHFECQDRGREIEVLTIGVPPARHHLNLQAHPPMLSELQCASEQVLDDLLEPLGVGDYRRGEIFAE